MDDNQGNSFYNWTCWLLAAFLYFFQYVLLILPSSFSKGLTSSLKLSSVGYGLLASSFLIPYVVMQIPVGILFDRYRAKYLLILSALGMALGCYVLGYAQSLWTGLLGRLLMGFGGSFAFVGALCVGKKRLPLAYFPIVVGLTEALSGVGEWGGSALFAWLTRFFSWRSIVLVTGFIIFIFAWLIFFYIHEAQLLKVKSTVTVRQEIRNSLENSSIWLLSLFIGFGYSQFIAMTDLWGVPFLQYRYHLETLPAVIDNDMVIIGFTLGCAGIGWVARYIRERKIILISSIMMLLILLTASYSSVNIYLQGILLFFLGLFTASLVLGFDIAKRVVADKSYGVVAGFMNMFFGGFGIVLNPLIGILFLFSNYNISIAVIPVMVTSFIAVVLAFFIYYDRHFQQHIS